MKILITGGTGFLGRSLCAALLEQGHAVTVLSRQSADAVGRLCGGQVKPLSDLAAWRREEVFDAVVNLAGAPVFDRHWSAARKTLLWESRVGFTQRLVARMAETGAPPQVLLSASAVGIYGDCGERALTEEAAPAEDFLGRLCAAWEAAAMGSGRLGVRVCLLRTGLVLHASGGMLRRMRLPFRCGLGARLGDGRQWMSWIGLEDWVGVAMMLLEDGGAAGAYNLTAPQPVTNAEFTAALAQAVHRPALASAPAWLLRGLLGERASMLLGSQRALPQKALMSGYRFKKAKLAF
ncbi:MAG: TIGR01777 family oxidoreductase [Kiritimatiellae bacterium]|nr:TIGR01777 family oxidoreductase [Kiritimatiellia bacterium]